jgi:YHS domain-containing protein
MRKLELVILAIVLISAAGILVTGCEKDTEPAGQTESDAAESTESAEQSLSDAAKNVETVQQTCPVMGGDINPELYTEYKGKKVYFCCKGCKEKFEANPEEYLSKLPQFEE